MERNIVYWLTFEHVYWVMIGVLVMFAGLLSAMILSAEKQIMKMQEKLDRMSHKGTTRKKERPWYERKEE